MASYKLNKFLFLIIGVVSLSLAVSSCASSKRQISKPEAPSKPRTTYDHSRDVHHSVRKGETLWRISKIYNVPVATIKEANRLTSETIKVGDKLFIPAATGIGTVIVEAGKLTARTLSPRQVFPKIDQGIFIWPARGAIVTRFGVVRDDVRTKGIDIATNPNQPVYASRAGKVSFTSESVKGYGKMIVIDHPSGFQTVYACNSKNLVKKGQKVGQGDIIARTGALSRVQKSGLHFEVRKNHQPLNPESFLK